MDSGKSSDGGFSNESPQIIGKSLMEGGKSTDGGLSNESPQEKELPE